MKQITKKKNAKSKIVTAAWQLFHDKGYQATTVDDIIRLSGTSKGSFYYYFSTKNELLNTLPLILDEYYEKLEAQMDPDMDSFQKLLYLNCEAHRMMEEHISRDLITSLYSSQLVSSGERNLLDHNRKYYRLVNQIIAEGQRRRQIRDDMTASDIAEYFSMCERALVTDWCLYRGEFSLSDYSRIYMPIMLEHFKLSGL